MFTHTHPRHKQHTRPMRPNSLAIVAPWRAKVGGMQPGLTEEMKPLQANPIEFSPDQSQMVGPMLR